MPVKKMLITGVALTIGAMSLVTTADARQRWHRHHHGDAFAAGAFGFAAGALLSGAFAGPRYGYYNDYPGYYSEPDYYYAPAPRVYYRQAPAYYEAPGYYQAPEYYYDPCDQPGSKPVNAMC